MENYNRRSFTILIELNIDQIIKFKFKITSDSFAQNNIKNFIEINLILKIHKSIEEESFDHFTLHVKFIKALMIKEIVILSE